jgi:phosphatidylglycerophosphate synthase
MGEIGYANLVTAGRLALVLPIAAFAARPATPALGWIAVGVCTTAALLDIVDGRIARRTGTTSAFGARFDMEVDAVLIMVLAVLAWRWDKAGAWVLLSGTLRYAFVAAALVLPWLAAPLPPSLRRKTVCVVQIVALIVVMGPIVRPPLSTLIAAAGLAALSYSFLVDTAWLWRSGRVGRLMPYRSGRRGRTDLTAGDGGAVGTDAGGAVH